MRPEAAAPARIASAALACLLAAHAPESLAYVGPGAGLGIFAALAAVAIAILATLVGLVLWPVRWLARRRKAGLSATKPSDSGSSG
jgi:hypothetical protein